jgi:Ca2+/Na+ antiporter
MGRVLFFLLLLVLWPILSVTGPRWLLGIHMLLCLFVLLKLLIKYFIKITSSKKATKSTDSDQPWSLFSADEPD